MDVEELLNDNDIHHMPRGGDVLVRCLNPEHEDRNPSMRIDSITGIFQCFSCGFKGNIFTHFGEVPNLLQIKRDLLKKRIKMKRAESIGLDMPKGAEPYTGTWRDIKTSTYELFKAFQHNDPDFIGRIVFPISDISGRISAFTGRHTGTETPKYKIVPPGANIPMYPMPKPYRGHVILVEGIFDAINLYDKGLTNVICIFGTRLMNEQRIGLLKMSGVTTVDIFMDGDDAGKKAAEFIKKLCETGEVLSRDICLEGTDPGALTQKQVTSLARKLYG